MKKSYSIEKLFNDFSELRGSNKLDLKDNYLNQYMKNYRDIVNPDFLALITTKSFEPILYEKNFNLEFCDPKKATVQGLIECALNTNSNHSQKLQELDIHLFNFAFENPELITPEKNLYSIKTNIELAPGNIRAIKRDVILLSKDENNLPDLILIAWFDVTEFYGTKSGILVNVKDFSDNRKKKEPVRSKLNKELKVIASNVINLTKREKQILNFISQGRTSEQIALILNISKATVDTHRQNIIKKNNVSNTSAVLGNI